MAITDKTIEQLQAAVETKTIEVGGDVFTTRPVYLPPREMDSQPDPLRVSTLTGFIDYVKNHGREAIPIPGILILVISQKEVRFVGPIYGDFDQRDTFAVASFEDLLGASFQFGKYYDHESFIVGLMSLFEPTPERAEILRVIGTIKESQVRETSDDGVSQAVTAKAGVALVTNVTVPNPVSLRPFRTFREIEQPPSLFILRVKSGNEGEKPQCALFEADGGFWKLTAIQAIRTYIQTQITDVPVIA